MTIDRDTVRVVLPPLMALTLVALLVSPLSAAGDPPQVPVPVSQDVSVGAGSFAVGT